ncbi:MAG: (d)CMP kinase [Tissierellia bacterium]|nr:(d)CMP kinase [Tissierellia bacterium]
MTNKTLIAIDGPSGAGKSTIAKALAKELNISYVDTGAMYRAFAFKLKELGKTDYTNVSEITEILSESDISFEGGKIFLDGVDISDKIRTEEIGSIASQISSISEVREHLVAIQQNMSKVISMIMDGRDIGTVVLPDAEHKFYINADVNTRAERRYLQLKESGNEEKYEIVLKKIIERDHDDMTREASPLKKADDAIEIDTTFLSLEETINKIISYIKE